MDNNRYFDISSKQKYNILQILKSKRPGTKKFTTPTVQKLQEYSFKFEKSKEKKE